MFLSFAVEPDKGCDRRTQSNRHDYGEHSVSPSPLVPAVDSLDNFSSKPGINDERGGQHGTRETTPLERCEIRDDDIVGQVQSGATDGNEDLANDVGCDGVARGDDNVSDHVEYEDQEIGVRTRGDIGDLGDEGLAHGADDTCGDGKSRQNGTVLFKIRRCVE